MTMRRGQKLFVLLLLLGLIVPGAFAETITESSISTGYTGNLFNDSSAADDYYSTFNLELKNYHKEIMAFTIAGQYNRYYQYQDLSSVTGGTSLTIMPLDKTSPMTLAFAGQIAYQKYGAIYALYDNVGASVAANFTYRVSQRFYFLSGISFLHNTYTNTDYGSNQGFLLASGFHLTPFGSNALSINAEFSRKAYEQPVTVISGNGNSGENTIAKNETYDIAGLTARFSRPIGKRTGISLSGGYRHVEIDNDFSVQGYSIDYLSPWAELWEGGSLSGTVKHFFPKQITTEITAAYYDKNFVDIIELDELLNATYPGESRVDRLTTISASFSRPFVIDHTALLKPTVFIGYRHNNSTIEKYTYDTMRFSLALNLVY